MPQKNVRSLAEYLNENPEGARKLRFSVSTMLAQYKVMDSVFAAIGEQLRTLQEKQEQAVAALVSSVRISVPEDMLVAS